MRAAKEAVAIRFGVVVLVSMRRVPFGVRDRRGRMSGQDYSRPKASDSRACVAGFSRHSMPAKVSFPLDFIFRTPRSASASPNTELRPRPHFPRSAIGSPFQPTYQAENASRKSRAEVGLIWGQQAMR